MCELLGSHQLSSGFKVSERKQAITWSISICSKIRDIYKNESFFPFVYKEQYLFFYFFYLYMC